MQLCNWVVTSLTHDQMSFDLTNPNLWFSHKTSRHMDNSETIVIQVLKIDDNGFFKWPWLMYGLNKTTWHSIRWTYWKMRLVSNITVKWKKVLIDDDEFFKWPLLMYCLNKTTWHSIPWTYWEMSLVSNFTVNEKRCCVMIIDIFYWIKVWF